MVASADVGSAAGVVVATEVEADAELVSAGDASSLSEPQPARTVSARKAVVGTARKREVRDAMEFLFQR